MKLVDEKGKLFGKINPIDLAVILLLLLAMVVTGLKLTSGKAGQTAGTHDVTIRYTLYIRQLRQVSVDAVMAETENITDAEYGGSVGHIVGEVLKTPAKVNVLLEDGTYTTTTYDDRYDLYVTLEAPGKETDTGVFTLEDRRMYFGGTVGINNGYVETFGEIVALEILPQQES